MTMIKSPKRVDVQLQRFVEEYMMGKQCKDLNPELILNEYVAKYDDERKTVEDVRKIINNKIKKAPSKIINDKTDINKKLLNDITKVLIEQTEKQSEASQTATNETMIALIETIRNDNKKENLELRNRNSQLEAELELHKKSIKELKEKVIELGEDKNALSVKLKSKDNDAHINNSEYKIKIINKDAEIEKLIKNNKSLLEGTKELVDIWNKSYIKLDEALKRRTGSAASVTLATISDILKSDEDEFFIKFLQEVRELRTKIKTPPALGPCRTFKTQIDEDVRSIYASAEETCEDCLNRDEIVGMVKDLVEIFINASDIEQIRTELLRTNDYFSNL